MGAVLKITFTSIHGDDYGEYILYVQNAMMTSTFEFELIEETGEILHVAAYIGWSVLGCVAIGSILLAIRVVRNRKRLICRSQHDDNAEPSQISNANHEKKCSCFCLTCCCNCPSKSKPIPEPNYTTLLATRDVYVNQQNMTTLVYSAINLGVSRSEVENARAYGITALNNVNDRTLNSNTTSAVDTTEPQQKLSNYENGCELYLNTNIRDGTATRPGLQTDAQYEDIML
ncbi:hypothetical protein DPMN_079879 [Dreissena polymorpha]|uniref:Uncharacterized protein n=1 Tax=Dreissena polymorpha TaxID=45954 RepID=A0A9D3YVA4_DREPO|nr:hypothetical protein DPMN_079879 [Dreissena polymorpha]